MAKGAGKVIGGIVTLLIGGTVYSVSQGDIANKFSEETGMSQTAAEQYVESIPEDELISFYELGSDYISEGQEILNIAYEIDCKNYIYDWESSALSCQEGKSQMRQFGENEIALGRSYIVLSSESATTSDMYSTIRLIDRNTELYSSKIVTELISYSEINEVIKTNSYNKAVLLAALDSD
jgi:hypothetical protein